MDTDPLQFGRYRIDPAQRALWVDGEPARLGPRAFDILLALAERRDRIVSKGELMELIWPKLVVEENNLQVHVSALRKLVGADVISTIPGRGYRFTAPLEGAVEPVRRIAAATAAPSNLPVEQPPLFGRDDELATVQRLLEQHRLVTITGAGGIGKTRVAQAAAHALRGACADGVWLVELAPLADAALLPAAVAQALKIQLRGVRHLSEELVDALQSQRLLLLLDNCEHLVDEVSLLAQALLARTPHVRLLVTSQEPLKLPGEQLFRLDTLAVPSADSEPAQALRAGAVRLFVERVQALDARFVLDAHNVAAVIDVVRHLDGLALAIELAAARVPALGVQGVRERLGERLRMLTAGARIALRRYQTLRAALDWSFGLLDTDEQAVFRRLGVFCGGCTIEAVQAVAADEWLDEWAVLDLLARLVDKSLVVADGDDRPRYRLLESARAYALEKLAAAGETDALARKHAQHFAAAFEQLVEAWCAGSLGDDAWIAARALELDNLRAALGWALAPAGDTDTAITLLAHSAPLSLTLPLHDESERWCEQLAEQVHAAPSPQRLAWNAYLQVHWRMLRLRGIRRGQALPFDADALRRLPDARRRAHTLYCVALHATWVGDLATAQATIAEADALPRDGWAGWLWVLQLQVTIRARHLAGDARSAAGELRRELARLESLGLGDGRSAFIVRTDLALDSLAQGEFEAARAQLDALVNSVRRQQRDPHRMSVLFAHWVLALAELGRLDAAAAAVREALPWLRRTGLWGVFAPVLALVAARRGGGERAGLLLGAGDAQLERSGLARSLLERRAVVQVAALLQGAPEAATWRAEGRLLDEEAFARLAVA